MGRRRQNRGFDALAALPWPLGLAAGVAGFIAVRYGFVWWMTHQGGPLAQGFAHQSGAMFAPLAWMLLGICWLATLSSFIGSRHRRKLLDMRTTLDSLAAGGWPVPSLRLGGHWLEQLGFAIGSKLRIAMREGELVVTIATEV